MHYLRVTSDAFACLFQTDISPELIVFLRCGKYQMEYPLVQDVYSKIAESVSDTDSLTSCLARLKELGVEALSVRDSKSKYVGMISMRRLRRSRLSPANLTIRKIIEIPPRVQMRDSISEAARLMIESGAAQLPVYSGERFRGIITREYILDNVMEGPLGNAPVTEIMSKKPEVVTPDDTAASALNLFREHGISHAPVVKDGRAIGMVSLQDIVDLVYKIRNRTTKGERVGESYGVMNIEVRGVMSSPVVTVGEQDALSECFSKMKKEQVSCLVVTKDDDLTGIVTKLDFLEPLSKEAIESRRLTVQFAIKPSVDISDRDRDIMMKNFASFRKKFDATLGKGILFVYLKTQGSVAGKRTLVQCRMNLRTVNGQYHSSSEGWSTLDAFSVALDRLIRHAMYAKDMKTEPKISSRFVEGFIDSEM